MTAFSVTSLAHARASVRGRLRLRGPAWLVWRQHRAWFRLWGACSVVMTGYLVYWHLRYHATFVGLTDPGPSRTIGLPPDIGLTAVASLLAIAPGMAAVTFGAPLFEHEYTSGTARLVHAQSVSGDAWVLAKLWVPAAAAVACVTPCAAALTWDLHVDYALQAHWHDIGVFDAIGPVAVAMCLAGLFLGAAAGLTWRRGAPSKFLALASVVAFEAVVFRILPYLWPALPVGPDADPSQSRRLYHAWILPSGSAAGGYLPYSDLAPLQWIVTAICAALCAALTLYCLQLTRRRPC